MINKGGTQARDHLSTLTQPIRNISFLHLSHPSPRIVLHHVEIVLSARKLSGFTDIFDISIKLLIENLKYFR